MILRKMLAFVIAFSICGCGRGPGKPGQPPAPPNPPGPAERLFQLNDEQWVDLSDVREVLFLRDNSPGSDPFVIAIWHRNATDNPFRFSFTDETQAYDSWKRLTAQLGGSLKESDWKPAAVVAKPAAPESAPDRPQALFQNHPTNFTIFHDDMNQLTACRDEKLITPDEFNRAHDQKVADFVASGANGSGYQATFGELHSLLRDLEGSKADHLLTDEQFAAMHKSIVSRYILASN